MNATTRGHGVTGFTIVELLVYMVISVAALGAIMGVFVSQWRQFGLHRETVDARETIRGAAALLTSELRGLSASGGDLYAVAPQSISFRSSKGVGVICGIHPTEARYGVWDWAGQFEATVNDSMQVYSWPDSSGNALRTNAVFDNPAVAGVPTCSWGGGFVPDGVIEAVVATPSDTADIKVGSVIRTFRSVEFAMFSRFGRWWLGRKVGAAVGYQLVTGPLRAPADSGLVLHYYDAAGAETAVPANVARVEIELRSESLGQAGMGRDVAARFDSVTVAVFLRN